MKNLICCTIVILIAVFCYNTQAQNRSIKFEHGSLDEIKAKAAKEKKLIFVDCYTSWCGPCKWMSKNIFTNDTVADFFNEKFINAKFDMELGEGKDLAKAFNVRSYPTWLFLDAEGKVVHRAGGTMKVPLFVKLGENALNPATQYASLVKKYNEGNREPSFVLQYIDATSKASGDLKPILESWFDSQKDEDLISQVNWNIINKHIKGITSKVFTYLVKNATLFESKYTADSVNNKIFENYQNACMNIFYNPKADKKDYLPLKEQIQKSGFKRTEELLLTTDLSYYQQTSDFEKYAITATALIDKYKSKDANTLNMIAWTIYENVKDKKILVQAENWVKKAVEILSNEKATEDSYGKPAAMDTYARLMFLNGKKKEAIKMEEDALDIIKKMKPDNFPPNAIQEYEAEIEKMKNSK